MMRYQHYHRSGSNLPAERQPFTDLPGNEPVSYPSDRAHQLVNEWNRVSQLTNMRWTYWLEPNDAE